MSDQVHYSNRYANIIGYVAENGPCSIAEVTEALGFPDARRYLARAVRRGHIYRPERGVYSTVGQDPTNHWHRTCDSCGQPMPAGLIENKQAGR